MCMAHDAALNVDKLREYTTFRNIADDDLLVLCNQLKVQRAGRGEELFRCGDIDTAEVFLLVGKLQLIAEDGRERSIDASDEAARMPIARLRPRQFTARAMTHVEYFQVDCDLIEALSHQVQEARALEADYGVTEIEQDWDEREEMLAAFKDDLQANKFTLTSLPEIAISIRKALDEEKASFDSIAKVVNRDPAIAAKLVKAANSPIFYGSQKCDSVKTAIARLGLLSTRQLIYGFTMRDLFKSEQPLIKKHMAAAWEHAINVAAISAVLARHTRLFAPEEAMLAGLLSNIGVVSILNYAGNYPQLLESDQHLQRWLDTIKGEVGALVLEEWGFPDELVEVARGCEDWLRCPTNKVDLCDLVLVATLHAYIGKRRKPAPPRLDQVPAMTKLSAGKLTPDLTVQLLSEARRELSEARALLAA
ncbi:MAG TPA: HDOD domain-containing protein [Spongiibacteraceae bacterium]|nr:HDOD domain-containing protein [Spongiibacteraceae bacterium]